MSQFMAYFVLSLMMALSVEAYKDAAAADLAGSVSRIKRLASPQSDYAFGNRREERRREQEAYFAGEEVGLRKEEAYHKGVRDGRREYYQGVGVNYNFLGRAKCSDTQTCGEKCCWNVYSSQYYCCRTDQTCNPLENYNWCSNN